MDKLYAGAAVGQRVGARHADGACRWLLRLLGRSRGDNHDGRRGIGRHAFIVGRILRRHAVLRGIGARGKEHGAREENSRSRKRVRNKTRHGRPGDGDRESEGERGRLNDIGKVRSNRNDGQPSGRCRGALLRVSVSVSVIRQVRALETAKELKTLEDATAESRDRWKMQPLENTQPAPEMAKGSRVELVTPSFVTWSERKDSNLRPSDPKSDALPGCATLRQERDHSVFLIPAQSKPSDP
jgi:hypothetical protein